MFAILPNGRSLPVFRTAPKTVSQAGRYGGRLSLGAVVERHADGMDAGLRRSPRTGPVGGLSVRGYCCRGGLRASDKPARSLVLLFIRLNVLVLHSIFLNLPTVMYALADSRVRFADSFVRLHKHSCLPR